MDPSPEKIITAYTFFGRTEESLLRDLTEFMKIYAPKTLKYLVEKNKKLRSHIILDEMIFAHRKFFVCSQFYLWNGKFAGAKKKSKTTPPHNKE